MKIISNPVKICSGIIFPMCFKVKIFLIFVEFFLEQIFRSLIIYKSSRHAALTIANAKMPLCAESENALTRFFVFLPYRFPQKQPSIHDYASVASMSAAGKSRSGDTSCKLRTSRFFIGGIAFISVPSTAACSTRRKSPWLTKSTRCASG